MSRPSRERVSPDVDLLATGPTFVGRRAELDVLERLRVDAWAGNPSVAFVEGESGMGKSTLLSKFLGHVASARILRAGGDEAEMLMPYGLIEQIVEGAGTGSVAGMKVLGSSIDADTDPLAVGSELLELLGFLQSDCPVVLAIDDLHWADSRPRPKPSSSRSDGCKAIKCSPS